MALESLKGKVVVVTGAALLPLAEPRLSARSLGEILGQERARGARVAAYRLTEGSLGQFLFYSGGTMEWIGKKNRGSESACTDCKTPTSAEEFLAGPGSRACLFTEADFARRLPRLRGGRVVMRGKVGGASYVLYSSIVRMSP